MLGMPLKMFPSQSQWPRKLFLQGQCTKASATVVQGELAPSLAKGYWCWFYKH